MMYIFSFIKPAKIAGRNINNLRYADTILMEESEKELKSLNEGERGEW